MAKITIEEISDEVLISRIRTLDITEIRDFKVALFDIETIEELIKRYTELRGRMNGLEK